MSPADYAYVQGCVMINSDCLTVINRMCCDPFVESVRILDGSNHRQLCWKKSGNAIKVYFSRVLRVPLVAVHAGLIFFFSFFFFFLLLKKLSLNDHTFHLCHKA